MNNYDDLVITKSGKEYRKTLYNNHDLPLDNIDLLILTHYAATPNRNDKEHKMEHHTDLSSDDVKKSVRRLFEAGYLDLKSE